MTGTAVCTGVADMWQVDPRFTLVDRLDQLAAARPEDVLYRFLVTGEVDGVVEERTFASLRRRVQGMASTLRRAVPPGARVLLLCEGGLEFVDALWACFHAGVIGVPAYPPEPTRWHRTLPRLRAILADAQVDAVLVDRATAEALADRRAESGELGRLPWFVLDELCGPVDDLPVPRPEDVAYLQYTSGSTGDPKGVIVTHANLSHNCEDLMVGWRCTTASSLVSWLPTFHDMGLIWGLLMPAYLGFTATLMQPVAFLQRPVRWLQALTAMRGTHTAAPNFAYDLCVRKVGERDLARLDLSSLLVAVNAAEPVRVGTMRAFLERFGPVGFQPTALSPCFGMAEATLKVTCSTPDAPPRVLPLDARALEGGRVVPVEAEEGAVLAVGCGRPALGTELAIADPAALRRAAPDRVGELWVRGPGVAVGYWGREAATEEIFRAALAGEEGGPWLRTGDLAFLHDGELFITGRLKDVIIVRGRNLYPQDIEQAVEGVPGVRLGCVAAFPVASADSEGLCVVAEANVDAAQAPAVLEAIRHVVFSEVSLVPERVVLIPPHAILKTSSGKIMRRGTRQALEAGELTVVAAWSPPAGEAAPSEPTAPAAARPDRDALLRLLREAVREVVPGPAITPGQIGLTFESLGLDSVRGVELASLLTERLGLTVPNTLIFDCPSLGEAADHLLGLASASHDAEVEADVWRFATSALHTEDLTTLLRAIVDAACHMFGAERGTVFLYDAERFELYSRVATADSPQGEAAVGAVGALRLPADRGIAGHALTTASKVHVDDAYADLRFDPSHDARTGFRTRTIDAVPLMRGGRVLGVLQLLNRRESGWDARGLERLDRMADLAALALEQAVAREGGHAGEPVAIVSMACRFPGGVDSPEALWELLAGGLDGVTEVPPERWEVDRYFDPDRHAAGRTYTRWGGFVGDVTAFDAELFGITPREARSVDPQARLLLETTTELLERAGWPIDEQRGRQIGVYVGLCGNEYLVRAVSDLAAMDAWSLLGTAHSAIVGRLSYWLGLEGPNLAVDTACSSSLVALHLAAQALRAGECTAAIAGGVNLILDPSGHVYLSRLQAMSPTGRCRTFAADADGYVRAEGCGVLLLERLSDALAAGHPVLAVLRGSAVNQDGRSAGFTAPNGAAQQAVVRAALGDLAPASVSYVECHGTGTPLGDPVEVQALAAVYGEGREDRLRLGSVKSHIGHAEGAAGVAGVIKTVLCLQKEQLPANLHLGRLNPHVPWGALPVEPVALPVPWPRGARPRRAGVSSFGFSGTNAHAILEEAPSAAVVEREPPAEGPRLFVLSALTPDALAAQASRLADHLAATSPRPDDLAWSLARTRAAWPARLAVVADGASLSASLRAFVADGAPPEQASLCARAGEPGPKVVFVYPGQGAQWPAMGRALLASSAVFREAVEACDAALSPHLGWSVRSVLDGTEGAPALVEDEVVQPALFAMGVGLTALWRSLGVTPTATVGHSQGEITAAWAAGCLSLEDAARVIVARARLLPEIAGQGAMLAVELPLDELERHLAAYGDRVGLGVVNSTRSAVVTGDAEVIAALGEALTAEGVSCRRTAVRYASHSAHVDPLLGRLRAALDGLAPHAGAVRFVSTVTGGPLDGASLDAGYWCENLRRPVWLDRALDHLLADEHHVLVEVSPHALLSGPLLAAAGRVDGVAVDTLRRGHGGLERVLTSLGALWARGARVDVARWFDGEAPQAVPLPTYPFQRQRYWLDRVGSTGVDNPLGHPLLGALTALADGRVYTARLSLLALPWLGDHRVRGEVIVPGAAIVEAALAAAGGAARVEELTLLTPLRVPEEGAVTVQLRVDDDGAVSVHTQPADGGAWSLVATGRIAAGEGARAAAVEVIPEGSVEGLYEALAARGLAYGPAFRRLRGVARGEGRIVVHASLGDEAPPRGFAVHPALLDAVLHALATVLPASEDPWLPFVWRGVHLVAGAIRDLVASIEVRRVEAREAAVSLVLSTPDGALVGGVEELVLRRLTGAGAALYRVDWQPLGASAPPASREGWWVLGLPGGLAAALGAPAAATPEALQTGRPSRVIVDLTAETDAEPVAAIGRQLALAQALLREPSLAGVPQVWVTRGAVSTDVLDPVHCCVGAAAWGLLRAARHEHPDAGLRLVDVDGGDAAGAIADDAHPELAVRLDRVFAPSLVVAGGDGMTLPAAGPWQISAGRGGSLDDLELVPAARPPLAPGEVRVEVRALGLNFLDVVRTLGMVRLSDRPLLGEGAGTVVEVGPGVERLRVGDRIMGLFRTAGGDLAVADARLLAPMPTRLGFAEAATLPVNFLTALYALQDLASLRAGERVLIHAAASGTGMAAVQLARRMGAVVVATASRRKWPVLSVLGIPAERVASSRDTRFVEAFGAGVDVVLNALAGEYVDASLRLLGPGGRFLEMGKTDIRDPEQVAGAHPGVRYRAFDLLEAGPEHLGRLLGQLAAWAEAGDITPLPLTAADLRLARPVFKGMANGQHTGKLVLQPPARLDPGGSVLITGGTGELGRAVAEQLVGGHGVRHLVLTSRSGPEAPDAAALVDALRARGAASVSVVACDVAEADQVERLLAAIPGDRPLTAVFHLAGVLDDGPLGQITPARLERVLRPKVLGAYNLHRLTASHDLRAFVLFSSIAGVLGSGGQASYGAANALLDALAVQRRAAGLPAQSLAWGLWQPGGRGMTAHLGEAELGRLRRQGIGPLSMEAGLQLLDAALRSPSAALVPASLQVSEDPHPLLRALAPRAARPASGAARLEELPPEEREAALRGVVLAAVAAVTGQPAHTLSTRRSLDDLGVDSLLRVELRNRLARVVGSKLPGTFTYDHDTVESMTRALLALAPGELAVDRPAPPPPPPPAAPRDERPPAARARAAATRAEREAILRPALELELERALGRSSIDPRASLAALGVDEVLGAELCLRIYRNVGVRVFPREILDCADLAELTQRVAGWVEPLAVSERATPLVEVDAGVRSPFNPGPVDGPLDEREMIFLLSPPRSGSTLLRVMLAGHSRLFAPQELHLMGYTDMASYDRHLRGTALNMGILNVIGEVTSKAGAWNLYREWVRDATPTAEVVRFIQARIGDRILVDKSPFFFDPLPTLLAAAERYPNARFLHLVRHPAASIGSYVEQRFHAIFEQTRDLPPHDQAEWCWTRVHQGILAFQRHIPAHRMARVYFEDIVTDPERTMRRLCPALGLAFEPALLRPYSGHRMVSGGFQIGDPNFTQHNQIVADKSTAWIGAPLPRPLQAESVEVAVALGYEPHPAWARPVAAPAAPRPSDDQAMGGLDLERDVTLLDHLPSVPPRPPRPLRTALLTGATGFLGAFLLWELLRRTEARVLCLVRAPGPEEGLERVRRNLTHYGLWEEAFEGRVAAVGGDLERDGLGLDAAGRAALADVDAIYHCAARISWLMPYRLLRASNVLGMTRLVELAASLGGPTLHVVSSLGATFVRPFHDEAMVAWTQQQSGLGTESIFELPLGYMETKWVVDRLAERARARGLVVNRYSPGLICGHSETGLDSLSDSQFVYALIKGSAQLGVVPDGHGWRFCPVDVVARDIVATSLLPEAHNMDLCIDSATVMDPADLVDVMRERRMDVRIEPYAAWRQKVLDLADRDDRSNALYAFTDTIFALTPLRFHGQRLQLEWRLQNPNAPEAARAALEPRRHLHRTLLGRMVDYYVQLGEMPVAGE